MKLKLVVSEKGRLTGKSISVSAAGVFSFSKELITETGLKEDDKLNFYQDEENPRDWFLCAEKEGQLILRSYAKNSSYNTFMANNSDMAKKLRKSLGLLTAKSFKVPVGVVNEIEGVKYWPLITAAIK